MLSTTQHLGLAATVLWQLHDMVSFADIAWHAIAVSDSNI